MFFRTMCPSCHHVYKIKKESIHKIVPCSLCKFVFLIERLVEEKPLPLFIQIGVNKKKIKDEHINGIIEFYKRSMDVKGLEDYLISNGIVNEKEIARLHIESRRLEDKMFIKTVLNEGLVSRDDVTSSVKVQKRSKKNGIAPYIRDVMIKLGFISRKQMERMSAIQVGERKRLYDIEVKKELERKNPVQDKSLDLCKFAILHNFLTDDQFERARKLKSNPEFAGKNTMQILMEKEIISPQKSLLLISLKEYGKIRSKENLFGHIGIQNGILTKDMVIRAIKKQHELFKLNYEVKKLGDILKEQSEITDDDISQILLIQSTADKNFIEKLKDSSGNYSYEDDLELCEFGVTHNFIEREDLNEAISIRGKSPDKKPLIQILIEKNILTAKKALLLKTVKEFGIIRDKDNLFGQIAIKKELLKVDEVKKALKKQLGFYKENNEIVRIGNILINDGVLDKKNMLLILNEQEKTDDKIKESVEDKKSGTDSVKNTQSETAVEYIDRNKKTIKVDKITLEVTGDNLTAFIYLPEDKKEIDLDSIKELLEINEIVFGITDDDVIEKAIGSEALKVTKFVAAKGLSSAEGSNGSLKYLFDTNYLTAGEIREDGSIDFKERGETPFVKKGDIVAVKTPPVPGEHGMDIYGNQILCKEVNDPQLKIGKGIELSEDKLTAYAEITGRPDLSVGGILSVFDELRISENVDYKTGNVDFKGNIIINGTIIEGFSVNGVNITAAEIEGGMAKATNDLNISGGIIESDVFVEGTTQAMFVRNSRLFCFGDVIVSKEIIDSEIITSGQCIVERGHIINSKIDAKKGVTALHVGNDMTIPCKIGIGVDSHIKTAVALYNMEIAAYEEKIKSQKRVIDNMNALINESLDNLVNTTTQSEKIIKEKQVLEADNNTNRIGEISTNIESLDEALENMEKSSEEELKTQEKCDANIKYAEKIIKSVNDKLETVKAHRDGAVEWAKKQSENPSLRVLGTIARKTFISTRYSRMELKDTHRICSIKEVNNKLRYSDKERKERGIPDYEMVIVSDQKKYSK